MAASAIAALGEHIAELVHMKAVRTVWVQASHLPRNLNSGKCLK